MLVKLTRDVERVIKSLQKKEEEIEPISFSKFKIVFWVFKLFLKFEKSNILKSLKNSIMAGFF
jgi:hypothetical protein